MYEIKEVLTHDCDIQVISCRVSLLIPGDAGVGGSILVPLDILNDEGSVGVDSLSVVDGQLSPLPLPHNVAHWVAGHGAGLHHLRPGHHLDVLHGTDKGGTMDLQPGRVTH